jgi:hypothetical protein
VRSGRESLAIIRDEIEERLLLLPREQTQRPRGYAFVDVLEELDSPLLLDGDDVDYERLGGAVQSLEGLALEADRAALRYWRTDLGERLRLRADVLRGATQLIRYTMAV